jgi:hypothetical protein
MNNPFEGKAIKFATEQELNHLAELARGCGLILSDTFGINSKSELYFRASKAYDTYGNYHNCNQLPEITYSDFIASLPPIEPQPDMVNHPPHYTVNGIEVIDVIECYNLNFRLGNSVKYILRADRKGNKLQDINKAIWYLQREIEQSE